jgi:hypothetical protein
MRGKGKKMETIAELKQALAAAEAAYKADDAAAKKQQAHDRVVNEGGGGYSRAEAMSEAAYNKHLPIIKAAKDALFAATWTREVFEERRATWNAEVVKTKSIKELLALQNRLGYTQADLKKAKDLLGL